MPTEQFPKIEVKHRGGDTFLEMEMFGISLLAVNSAIERRNKSIRDDQLRDYQVDLREIFDRTTSSVVETLAVAVAFCNRCPIKGKLCSGMKNVNLMIDSGYEAILETNGVNSHNGESVEKQIRGNQCRVTVSHLNSIHPVKMKSG